MEYRFGIDPVTLRVGRVHDVTGLSAKVFAAIQAAQIKGQIVWINYAHQTHRLYPQGLADFFNPDHLIAVNVCAHKEALWCMEEALREAPAVVIAALSKPTDLIASRRLQLAAEAGGSTGLCLVPDVAVNNAAETRWRSTPLPTFRDSTLHRWELIKNKKGIIGRWDICWNASTHSFTVVSAPGGRARLAEQGDDGVRAPIRSGRDAQERVAALLDQRSRREGRTEARGDIDGYAGDLS